MDETPWLEIALISLLAAGMWVWLSVSRADVYVNPLSFEQERVALTLQEQIDLGQSFGPEFEAELGGRRAPDRFGSSG